MRAFNPKQRCVTEIESLLISRVLTWSPSLGWPLQTAGFSRLMSMFPWRNWATQTERTSTQTHHSRYAIPSRCIIAALWPKYFHHAGTITARSDCLERNKRSRSGLLRLQSVLDAMPSCSMQTLKKSMTPLIVFGNSRMDEFSPLRV